jgi:hypothetical protein
METPIPGPGSTLFFSFPGMRLGLAALALIILGACGNWKTDPATLTARSEIAAAGMSCVACHAYPPQDSNHLYHLYQTVPDKFANGAVTCLACHSHSLQGRKVAVMDTFFRNPDPLGDLEQVSSINYPVTSPSDTFSIRVRGWPIDSVVARPQNHPVAQTGRPPPNGEITEYMTGLAHLNGMIDVLFDPKHSDPARFEGISATYNPKQETCSAVACHPGNGPYRFAAPRKGLPGLKE